MSLRRIIRDSGLGNDHAFEDNLFADNLFNRNLNRLIGVEDDSAAGRLGASSALQIGLNGLGLGRNFGSSGSALCMVDPFAHVTPVTKVGYAVTPATVTTRTGVAIDSRSMNDVVQTLDGLIRAGAVSQADAAAAAQIMQNYQSHVLPPGTPQVLNVLFSMVMYARYFLSNNNYTYTFTALQNYIDDPVKDINARASDQNFAYAMYCIAHAMRTGVFNDVRTAQCMMAAHRA